MTDDTTRAATGRRPGTVVSPGFDATFFLLPPIASVAIVLAMARWPAAAFALAALVWLLLAQSHFGATALFFLDPDSRRGYLQARWTYLAIPAAIVVAYAISGFTRWAPAALALVPIASFWHGNRQSIGVCGLFRGPSRSFDPRTRTLEQVAIFAGSACFTIAGAARLGMLVPLGLDLTDLPRWVPVAWRAGLAGAALLLAAALANAARQSAGAGVAAGPRLWMLTVSWAMYAPYLVAPDPLSAYLSALVPHYAQYHGLVYLVNRNKVIEDRLPAGARLRRVASGPLAYAAHTVGFAVVLGGAVLATWWRGSAEAGLCLVAGINVAHFWLDGFFWRFRDPAAREATLRHIHPPAAVPAAAARA